MKNSINFIVVALGVALSASASAAPLSFLCLPTNPAKWAKSPQVELTLEEGLRTGEITGVRDYLRVKGGNRKVYDMNISYGNPTQAVDEKGNMVLTIWANGAKEYFNSFGTGYSITVPVDSIQRNLERSIVPSFTTNLRLSGFGAGGGAFDTEVHCELN